MNNDKYISKKGTKRFQTCLMLTEQEIKTIEYLSKKEDLTPSHFVKRLVRQNLPQIIAKKNEKDIENKKE